MIARNSRTALLCFLSVLAGCPRVTPKEDGPFGAFEEQGQELLLSRLERLAFVPAGPCRLPTEFSAPVDCSNDRPLLVDRFEVTEREWQEWILRLPEEERPPTLGPAASSSIVLGVTSSVNTDESNRHPARFMNFEEAKRFAAWRGMRLPTAREWFRVAAGTRVRRWPWGSYEAYGVANTLELHLESPTPVGVFERGASPLGIYDLAGNVAEWVDGEWELEAPGPLPRPAGEMTWAAGGSCLTRLKRIVDRGAANAQLLHRRHRASDVGLRLFADAEDFLSAQVGAQGAFVVRSKDDRLRLEALGTRWGREALPLLRRLRETLSDPSRRTALEALERGASVDTP